MAGLMMWSMAEAAHALDVVHEGTARPGEWVAGFRAGPSFNTSPGMSTVGPALNFQGLYGLNKWLRVGMMLQWSQHKIDGNGQLSTITLLPVYLEYRPGRVGVLEPYVASGIGVNINNKDVNDSFAFRVAGGFDYALTHWFSSAPKGLTLNTEVGWNRNTVQGVDGGAVSMLFGVRWSFGGKA
jgi:outer membrane protein